MVDTKFKWWWRFVPGFGWDAYYLYEAGKRIYKLAEDSPENSYILGLLELHLGRMKIEDKNRIIALLREILGIKPIKSRHLTYGENNAPGTI